jgi:hypothetical protein
MVTVSLPLATAPPEDLIQQIRPLLRFLPGPEGPAHDPEPDGIDDVILVTA